MKRRLYEASVFLFNAAVALRNYDENTSEYLLDIADKYLCEVENWDLKEKDKSFIEKFKEIIRGRK